MSNVNTKQATTVPLDRIICSELLQVRKGGVQRGTVLKYASVIRQGNLFPPIKLARIDGAIYCVDGFHRIQAHRIAERHEIEAFIVDTSVEEARWLAAEANLTHGLPLKPADLQEAFKRFVKARRHRTARGRFKTYRDIAAELGGLKAHTTIRNWMLKYFPSIYRAMGSDDTKSGKRKGRDICHADMLKEEARKALLVLRNNVEGLNQEDRLEMLKELNSILSEILLGSTWEPQESEPF